MTHLGIARPHWVWKGSEFWLHLVYVYKCVRMLMNNTEDRAQVVHWPSLWCSCRCTAMSSAKLTLLSRSGWMYQPYALLHHWLPAWISDVAAPATDAVVVLPMQSRRLDVIEFRWWWSQRLMSHTLSSVWWWNQKLTLSAGRSQLSWYMKSGVPSGLSLRWDTVAWQPPGILHRSWSQLPRFSLGLIG